MSRIPLSFGQSGDGTRLSSGPQNPAPVPARSARNLSGEAQKGSGRL